MSKVSFFKEIVNFAEYIDNIIVFVKTTVEERIFNIEKDPSNFSSVVEKTFRWNLHCNKEPIE